MIWLFSAAIALLLFMMIYAHRVRSDRNEIKRTATQRKIELHRERHRIRRLKAIAEKWRKANEFQLPLIAEELEDETVEQIKKDLEKDKGRIDE